MVRRSKLIIRYCLISSFFISCTLKNNKADQEASGEVSLLFIGDLMGHKKQIEAAREGNSYDYTESFEKIAPLLNSTDITIGNLELVLGGEPYTGYPLFSSPKEYAEAMKKAGVDVLMTANNHSCDRAQIGLEKTIKTLDKIKIDHTGTFKSKKHKSRNPAYMIDKNGLKIAVINYTFYTNGILPTHPNIVNYLDKDTISNDLMLVKEKEQPDVIIAFVHWGDQYRQRPNSWQREMNTYFNSLGVDIVIGSHPHVLQPMRWDRDQDTLVAYSLGNFISHQRQGGTDGGAALKLVLQKADNGKVKIKNAHATLTWVHEYLEDGKPHYQVLPVAEYLKKPSYFRNKKDYEELRSFAHKSKVFLKSFNQSVGVR